MDKNKTQQYLSSLPVEGRSRSEEMSDQPEEPDQRRQARDTPCLTLHEKIRLVALSLGLLALFTGFLFFLFSGAIFPLLAAVVVVFLGYRQIDSRLDAAERSGQDTALWSGDDQARRPS